MNCFSIYILIVVFAKCIYNTNTTLDSREEETNNQIEKINEPSVSTFIFDMSNETLYIKKQNFTNLKKLQKVVIPNRVSKKSVHFLDEPSTENETFLPFVNFNKEIFNILKSFFKFIKNDFYFLYKYISEEKKKYKLLPTDYLEGNQLIKLLEKVINNNNKNKASYLKKINEFKILMNHANMSVSMNLLEGINPLILDIKIDDNNDNVDLVLYNNSTIKNIDVIEENEFIYGKKIQTFHNLLSSPKISNFIFRMSKHLKRKREDFRNLCFENNYNPASENWINFFYKHDETLCHAEIGGFGDCLFATLEYLLIENRITKDNINRNIDIKESEFIEWYVKNVKPSDQRYFNVIDLRYITTYFIIKYFPNYSDDIDESHINDQLDLMINLELSDYYLKKDTILEKIKYKKEDNEKKKKSLISTISNYINFPSIHNCFSFPSDDDDHYDLFSPYTSHLSIDKYPRDCDYFSDKYVADNYGMNTSSISPYYQIYHDSSPSKHKQTISENIKHEKDESDATDNRTTNYKNNDSLENNTSDKDITLDKKNSKFLDFSDKLRRKKIKKEDGNQEESHNKDAVYITEDTLKSIPSLSEEIEKKNQPLTNEKENILLNKSTKHGNIDENKSIELIEEYADEYEDIMSDIDEHGHRLYELIFFKIISLSGHKLTLDKLRGLSKSDLQKLKGTHLKAKVIGSHLFMNNITEGSILPFYNSDNIKNRLNNPFSEEEHYENKDLRVVVIKTTFNKLIKKKDSSTITKSLLLQHDGDYISYWSIKNNKFHFTYDNIVIRTKTIQEKASAFFYERTRPGNTHWGDETDYQAFEKMFNIGLITFMNNSTKLFFQKNTYREYPLYFLIYYYDGVHFEPSIHVVVGPERTMFHFAYKRDQIPLSFLEIS